MLTNMESLQRDRPWRSLIIYIMLNQAKPMPKSRNNNVTVPRIAIQISA